MRRGRYVKHFIALPDKIRVLCGRIFKVMIRAYLCAAGLEMTIKNAPKGVMAGVTVKECYTPYMRCP